MYDQTLQTGFDIVVIKALRDINAGEPLLISYGPKYKRDYDPIDLSQYRIEIR